MSSSAAAVVRSASIAAAGRRAVRNHGGFVANLGTRIMDSCIVSLHKPQKLQ